MASWFQIIAVVLTVLGLGGILGAYFQSLFQHRVQVKEQERELKSKRYGAIIIQMLTVLDPKSGLRHTAQFRPDLKDVEDFKKEIEAEFLNSILFASDDVIRSIGRFIKEPNYSAYIQTVVAMRKDLWGKKTTINEETLGFSIQEMDLPG